MLPQISIYHDTRRAKANDVYPVKIVVYVNRTKRYYYPTGIDLTKDDFDKVMGESKVKGKLLVARDSIRNIQAKAISARNVLDPFTIDRFNKKFLNPTGSSKDVFFQYEATIKELEQSDRVNTSINYAQSERSLKEFLKERNRPAKLTFDMITPALLRDYESWMISKNRQLTSVGIYIRPLRAIYNQAIHDGDALRELYPFGKGKNLYQIPAGRNVKKALSKTDLAKLFNYTLDEDSPLYKARAFWFFSYSCSGMNIRDIAELKYKNISGSMLSFIRNKTKNTTKKDQKPIVVVLNPYAKEIIGQFGKKKQSGETYVFPILGPGMTETQKIRAVQNFTRFINQHIKKLAEKAKVDADISTYWARHSFTTVAIHNGASLEFIQDSLGHQNIATTMNYWKGFEESVKRDMSDKLMDF